MFAYRDELLFPGQPESSHDYRRPPLTQSDTDTVGPLARTIVNLITRRHHGVSVVRSAFSGQPHITEEVVWRKKKS